MIRTTFILILFILQTIFVFAQKHHNRFESIDVKHYNFEIHLNDTTDIIKGKAVITLKTLTELNKFRLDIVGHNELDNKGMKVSKLKGKGNPGFVHQNNSLEIIYDKNIRKNKKIRLTIEYEGIPNDGLVISENNHDERTFFGDNWPDRARNWLPTIDHPSDKATLEFKVYAPDHYEVVSNGKLVKKRQMDTGQEFTHWKEKVPLSTKLMVIGVADFEIGNKLSYKNIPVSSWVFEENKKQAFENYRYGTKALEYFSELIGPYSYEKLAHVQSKTRYGGMENAGCIFYHQRTGTSNRSQERLFAHEVAHQWFGNSVTEQNWHHVWLSEGFATYLTHVYNHHFYGDEKFRDDLKNDRERIIRYSKRKQAPIIDTTVTEYINLLNTNSYQKASWVLHMLRENLGDEVFFKGLRKYYIEFQNSTALTKDFKKVLEVVSGKELDQFFKQWIWQVGHPMISYSWEVKANGVAIEEQGITVKQYQNLFTFPLEVKIEYKDGSSEFKTFQIEATENEQHFQVKTKSKIVGVILDPNTKLLYEIAGKKY